MFLTPAAAVSVLGALSAFGVAEATYTNSGSSSKSCQSNYFWYDRLGCCLKNGGESTTPPSGNSCPDNFYWHTDEKCCVPKSSDTSKQVPGSCPSGNWSSVSWCCKSDNKPTSTSSCGNGFWWSPLNICVSIGGSGQTPPSGSSCPSNWSWLSSKSCCKPDQPDTPTTSTPSCSSNWNWHPGKQCCVPGESTPTPSHAYGSYGRKRHNSVHKRTSFCPTDYESCPIVNDSRRSTESECIDTRTQLISCGGCASIGKGQDCSKIPNAKVASCQASRCVIEKCKPGYELSGDSCVAQSSHDL